MARVLPDNLAFALYIARLVVTSRIVVALGCYDDDRWTRASQDFHDIVENMGAHIQLEGMDHLRATSGNAVIVANHMSTLEAFYLPHMINPILPATFVIKPSLMRMPLAAGVFRARDPIVVTRSDPRQDLRIVLEQGQERLASGRSVIIFPQSTRAAEFDPAQFNSLGVKLARRAGVPVIPIAVKTDAWSLGSRIKDFGSFDHTKAVRFAVGAPMEIEGQGAPTHKRIIDFIAGKLTEWKEEEAL